MSTIADDVAKCFKSFSKDDNFFWYSVNTDTYTGILPTEKDGSCWAHVVYKRKCAEVLDSLGYHKKHIVNVVIFPENANSGLPDFLNPVFVGSDWVDRWDEV